MYRTPNCYDAEPVRQWIIRFLSNRLKTTSLVTNSKHETIVLTPTQTQKHIEAKEAIAIYAVCADATRICNFPDEIQNCHGS